MASEEIAFDSFVVIARRGDFTYTINIEGPAFGSIDMSAETRDVTDELVDNWRKLEATGVINIDVKMRGRGSGKREKL
jgi:hypothetical protein